MEDRTDQMRTLAEKVLELGHLDIPLGANDAEALRSAFYQWRRGQRTLGEARYDGLSLHRTEAGLRIRLLPVAQALQGIAS